MMRTKPLVFSLHSTGQYTAVDAPRLPSDSFVGYQLLREIRRGGQGVVYQALQESTKRKIAIEVMKEGPFVGPADRARFERDVQIPAQLQHSNIVKVHDSGSAAGVFCFVTDCVSGQPLDLHLAGATEKEHGANGSKWPAPQNLIQAI
jgi:serine/threonine protein kinase